MKPAIRVENLSKRYRVGTRPAGEYRTLREAIVEKATSALRTVRPSRPNFGGDGASVDSCSTFWALKDVAFEIPSGEVVGVIGRNGAGKSTLLKILSRIAEPTSGRVELLGRVGSLLEVGTGFHPELTGRENIFLNGSILGMRRREIARQFDEIVAFAEVERFLDTPVKRYSSGMYVRLAFAVAAHLNPEILFVDEVLAVGDAAFQRKCMGKMKAVAGQGRTVLLVSHNMGAMYGLCREGLWLERGRVRSFGAIRPVISEYLSESIERAGESIDAGRTERKGEFGRSARLRSIEFPAGLPLRHGEPVRIRLGFEAIGDLCDVSVGVGFSSMEGTRILSLDSDFAADRRDVPAGRALAVELHLGSLPLSPGIYTLDAGIRSGYYTGLDYLPSLVHLEVVPGPTTPDHLGRQLCDVRLDADWDWSDVA